MIKTNILLALLVLLLVYQTYSGPTPPLCTAKLYSTLKNFTGKLSGTRMQLDLFNTMNYATFDQASLVLQRMAIYSSSISPFLRLINQSYALQRVYQSIDNQLKYNYDYQQYCIDDLCHPIGAIPMKSAIPTPKPSSLTTDSVDCFWSDNVLCSDFHPSSNPDTALYDQMVDSPMILNQRAELLYYRVDHNTGNIDYCGTLDPLTKKTIFVCERYNQWALKEFTPVITEDDIYTQNHRDLLLASDPSKQYSMNYIFSKLKFGQQLGRIYNDCLRYGPLFIPSS